MAQTDTRDLHDNHRSLANRGLTKQGFTALQGMATCSVAAAVLGSLVTYFASANARPGLRVVLLIAGVLILAGIVLVVYFFSRKVSAASDENESDGVISDTILLDNLLE